jgi:hypothetical protein
MAVGLVMVVVPEVGLEAEVAGDLVVVSVVEWELAIVLAEGLVVVVGSEVVLAAASVVAMVEA